MAQWQGMRQDTASLDGDGHQEVVNASFYVEGELRRRPGKSNRIAFGGDSMTGFKDSNGNWMILLFDQSAGTIKAAQPVGGATVNTLATGLGTSYNGNWAIANGRAYFAAQGTNIQVVEDATGSAGSAGITAPSSAIGTPSKSSGDISPGDHLFRYRYYDSSKQYFSDPSPSVSYNAASASEGSFSFSVGSSGTDVITSSNANVDKIIIEMTVVGGDQYYDALIFNNTSGTAVVNISDANLEQQPQRAGGKSTGNAAPPQLRAIAGHRARMFGIDGADPSKLLWSSSGRPEGWDTTSQARFIFSNSGDEPVALASVFDDLYIFGQNSIAKLRYYTDPGVGELDTIDSSGMGVWNQRCLVQVDGTMYGFGRIGAWSIPAGVPKKISRPVEDTLRSAIDESQSAKFHGGFDPRERTITWWYVPTGGSAATRGICYDVDRRTWSLREWQSGITASASVPINDGNLYLHIADANDYTWRQDQNWFDGVQAGTNTVFLAAAGSTTTVINVSAETVSANLAGAYLYHVSSGEYRLITGSTATTVTVGSAFTAVATNDEFWIGNFSTSITTKWNSAGGHSNKSRPHGIGVSMIADSNADGQEGKVEIFTDFGTTAEQATAGAADLFSSGVSVVSGERFVRFDLTGGSNGDGFLKVPMPSGWYRSWQTKLSVDKPTGTLRLLAFNMLADRHDVKEIVDE